MRRFVTPAVRRLHLGLLALLCSLTACGGLSEKDLEAARERTKAVCACTDLLCAEKARAAQPGVSAETRSKLGAKDLELLAPIEAAEFECHAKAAEVTAQAMSAAAPPP
jgi:hypothetical protein